ncbi:hypothetical protein ASPZODRAFT_135913 [Penicilliopsis zonata CBS 506.65]|uniref:N-acetyltransferase domain-containing protein n=1 Tax=Penicilliopsis zonata CBS 506.65 TaxID=1073090 RepID=A0A1L9S9R3_9EURO|nr:hypothetical protein ASPZODRAFT_135913 [Penicilliopsis zonata CBS 506.65]OJJ43878.1 hypothetical protein ASPZODRAFT_135913 [Penicilliopsis zonata CBS 506.65]
MKLPHRRTRVAIALAAPYQGKGYGIEALQWGLRFAFLSAGAHRVDLEAFGFNTHAMKAYEALGFIKEGALRECMFRDGKWEDFILYSMLEGEWRSRYSSSNQ